MTSADRHRRVADLLPAYALGTADPEERREVEEHLPECPECSQDLGAWRRTADRLAEVPPPVAPPPHVRDDLLRRVGAETGATGSRRRGLFGPRGRIVALAAAVAVLAVLGWSLFVQGRLRAELAAVQGQVARLEAELDDADLDLRRARTELTAATAVLELLASTPAGGEVVLAGLDAAPGGRARVFVDRAGGRAVLVAGNLPELPADRTYQLWTIADGTPRSAGVFEVRPDGTGLLLVEDLPAEPPATWAVTIEPAGGVPQPTGPMVLAGRPG